MRYGKCYSSSLLLMLAASLAFTSCKKENGIDNNKVIKTPYAVITGDYNGRLEKTNDGFSYRTLLPSDGVPYRAITASGDNGIVFVKTVLRYSSNNGQNFNVSTVSVNPAAKWASMLLDIRGDRLYVASTSGEGVAYSDNNGATWTNDADNNLSGASIASFAVTPDGNLYGLNPNGSNIYRKGLPSNTSNWGQVTVATGLPSGTWYLGNYNNTLLAADYTGAAGVFWSSDGGKNWTSYSGLPANQTIYCCVGALGQTVLAGCGNKGIYRLQGGSFVPSNNGLTDGTIVYGITGKQDTYKNGIIKRYVYIATSTGLYRSEDLGQNWVLMKPDNLRAIW